MRLLIISTMSWNAWGGSEELWAAVAREALEAGHEVGLAICRWPQAPNPVQELGDRGAKLFYRRERESTPIKRRIAWLDRPFRKPLKFKPDVVLVSQGITHDCCNISHGPQLRRFISSAEVPYVVLCHGNHEGSIPSDKQRQIVSSFFRAAAWVGFVSPRLIDVTQRQLAQQLVNAKVFRNPVNMLDRAPLPWPSDDTTRFAVVARLDANKGIDILLESLSRRDGAARDWSLSIFGDGPLRGYYEELAAHFGLAGRVKFRGHSNDVRAIWRDHHALVAPSRSEGVSIAVVEAMLCGRPVIATDVGGTGEWVVDCETGFLAEAPITKYFASALERAFLSRGQWESIGAAASRYANTQSDPAPGKTLLNDLSSIAMRKPTL